MPPWRCPCCDKTFKLADSASETKRSARCPSCGFTGSLRTASRDGPMTAPAGDRWFHKMGEVCLGPFSLAQLSHMIATEALAPDDLLRRGEAGEWRLARDVPEIAEEWRCAGPQHRISPEPTQKRPQTAAQRVFRSLLEWLVSCFEASDGGGSYRSDDTSKLSRGAAALRAAYLKAGKIGRRARNGRQARAAMAKMASILEHAGPTAAGGSERLRCSTSLCDDGSALEECRRMARVLLSAAEDEAFLLRELREMGDGFLMAGADRKSTSVEGRGHLASQTLRRPVLPK